MVDRNWNVGVHRHGVPRDACGQYHGLRAGAVQLLYCAAVRYGDPGDAVEASYALGRFSGTSRRNAVFDRNVHLGPARCWGSALHCDEFGREADGGESVPRTLELDYLRGSYGSCESGDETSANRTTIGARVRRDADSR